MKTKKLIMFLVLFLTSTTIAYSQNFWLDRSFTQEEQVKMDSMTNLSKSEMKEDIEFLCRVINEVNPQLKTLSTVMGIDIRDEINKLRLQADSVETFEEFYYLAQRILVLCNEAHIGFTSSYSKDLDDGENPYITEDGLDFVRYCELKYSRKLGMPFYLRYIDGKYFIPYSVYSVSPRGCHKPSCRSIYLPAGAQIIEVDNIPMDEYVSKYYGVSIGLGWDFEYNKMIDKAFLEPYTIGLKDSLRVPFTIKYKYKNKTEIVSLDRTNTGLFIRNDAHNGSDEGNVFWFNKTKTLYIRIPDMYYDLISSYEKKIYKYKDKDIDKIIIDIRGNQGGNDWVWMKILSAIIKKPISYSKTIYNNNTPLVRDYLTTIRKDTLSNYKSIKSTKFIYSDSVLVMDKLDEIYPSSKSLNYDGNIYVVYDEWCFSSSLAFVNVCTMSDQLISAGIPTNLLAGRSSTPYYLSLPNSKLIFRMMPDLDVSGAKTEKDLYDHSAELPISVDIEERVSEIEYKQDRYAKKYLLNYDNTIKTILELDESRKND